MVMHQNSELIFRKLIKNCIDMNENIPGKFCAKLLVTSPRERTDGIKRVDTLRSEIGFPSEFDLFHVKLSHMMSESVFY